MDIKELETKLASLDRESLTLRAMQIAWLQ